METAQQAQARPTSVRLTRKGLATRTRIVHAASELMFCRGVAGTSTEDVRLLAGISNSQLYHYFADKKSLVHAVIEFQTDQVINGQRPLLDELDSLDAFRRWRDMLVDLQRQRGCEGGCPLGSLSTELAETDEPARVALAAGFEQWETPIRDGLQRMRDRGQLRAATDVDQLALGTLAALQGGLLLTQARRNTAPLEAALDLAIDQIASHVAAAVRISRDSSERPNHRDGH